MSAILAIEDDPGIGSVLRRGLGLAGHAVTVVADGAAARQAWQRDTWDLVLLDVMLPDSDGLEILVERRAAGDVTPVVLLTAREESDLSGRVARAGASGHLSKPFAYAELLEAVSRHARSSAELGPAAR